MLFDRTRKCYGLHAEAFTLGSISSNFGHVKPGTNGLRRCGATPPMLTPTLRPLRLCIVDMNNAHVNQAMRCLRGIAQSFFDHVARANPELPCELVEISPRDTNNPVPRDCDLYVSSGGPGSPFDGDGQPWYAD